MLSVKTPEEVLALIEEEFAPLPGRGETVPLSAAIGRVLAEDVTAGDYLAPPYPGGSFDGILSQCSFYVSGNVPEALKQAGHLLRKGGKLVFSDVTENVVELLNQTRQAGFAVRHLEDLTDQWKEYYLEALWTQDHVCLPRGKKYTYVLFVCERM